MKRLLPLIVALACLSKAFATPGEVLTATRFLTLKTGKPKTEGQLKPGERVEVLSQTKNGKFLKINWQGREGYVLAAHVRQNSRPERLIASSTASEGPWFNSSGLGSVYGGLGLGTGFGVRFGLGSFFRLPIKMMNTLRVDVGPAVGFYPDVGGAGSALEMMALGRLMYTCLPLVEIGGEIGLAYYKFFVPALVPYASLDSLGLVLGGNYEWSFTRNLVLLAGIRLLFVSSVALQIHAALEYRFGGASQ